MKIKENNGKPNKNNEPEQVLPRHQELLVRREAQVLCTWGGKKVVAR